MEIILYGGTKCMSGLFLINSLWLSSQLWPVHFYLRDYVLTLCEGRVTQTWLMRRYWLWLLWQLLIRDWLGTVPICWGGRKETVCHDLVELLPLHHPHSPVRKPVCSNHFNPESSVNNWESSTHCTERYLMLNYWGRDWSWSGAARYCSDTWFCCRLRTIHPLCMVIKLSLRGCWLMGCCAEPRNTWKQRNERWRGLEEWTTGNIYAEFARYHWEICNRHTVCA